MELPATAVEFSRVDAGSRQLEAAVRLHFEADNELASGTLAAAAAWLFQALADIRDRGMRLKDLSEALAVSERLYIDALQSGQWFLQYSSVSRQRWTRFETELLIVAATLNAERLAVPLGPAPRIFKLWYFAKNAAAFKHQAQDIQALVVAAFPGLGNLPDEEQRRAGRSVLEAEDRRVRLP